MTGAFFGPAGVDLRPLVEEAVAALGYFEPSSVDELTALLERQWPSGTSKTMLIYGDGLGDNLEGAEREAAGIGKGRMPRAVWQLLSAAGRADPYNAIEATTLRIAFGVNKLRDLARESQWGIYVSRVELGGVLPHCCDQAKAMAGKSFPRVGRPALPLPGCGAAWCSCRWDRLVDD